MMELDEHDEACFKQGFVLAQTVKEFLDRNTTKRLIEIGFLPSDLTDRLIADSAKMEALRQERVTAARGGS